VRELSTARLDVRPWRLDEADRFYDLYRRIEVVRWLSAQPMANLEEAKAMILRNQDRLSADPSYGSWAIVPRAAGVPAGSVLLKPLPGDGAEIEIGWQLHPDSQGRGYATEAASALLADAFSDGLEEVWAVTLLDNNRSARVCERIGMRLLGITNRWYEHPSLMFWVGAHPGQEPSLEADRPVDG
jgi:RimJ/RimL family protein N-acetyltransferase